MARRRRVVFSNRHLAPDEISQHHRDIEIALRNYFSRENPRFEIRFAGYTPDEVRNEMNARLEEHERTTSLNLLAALEAAFRIDFLQRCYERRKDRLSRAFRHVYTQKGSRVSLEGDILPAWRENSSVPQRIISSLRDAFRYRHWLAHGRYWEPKLGQKYDYQGLATLAEAVFDGFPLQGD